MLKLIRSVLACSAALAAGLAPARAVAQIAPDTIGAPIAGTWDLPQSLGQPPIWRMYAGVGYGADRTGDVSAAGVTASFGLRRGFGNPVLGLFGTSLHGYTGQRGTRHDAGAKAFIEMPALFIGAGVDWNSRLGAADAVIAATFPLRRGGWPLPGTEIRVEWLPGRDNSLGFEALVPFRQPLAGRTRPRNVQVSLPEASRSREPWTALTTASSARELDSARERMSRLVSIVTFFWRISDRTVGYEGSVRTWRANLTTLARDFLPAEQVRAGESQYEREARAYHAALDRAFGFAAGAANAEEVAATGRPLADAARRIALLEVVFPYNRSVGQYRRSHTLEGFLSRARARYGTWLRLHSGTDPQRQRQLMEVMENWLLNLEATRAQIERLARDTRMLWLPTGLAIRPEEHRTQTQIDELLAAAIGDPFESGNVAFTIDAPRFQWELRRSIHETKNYHVLWVHDYRGFNGVGAPDTTGFETTLTYLRALRNAVQRYDRTGRFPVFLVLLDQFYYEENRGRLWITLLEDPLRHRVRLRPEHAAMENRLVDLQDSLRWAVAESVRLQSQITAFGNEWLNGLVKVHVNITNPSDFTFRSRRLMGLPFGTDNVLRDHRKLVLRDIDEANPDEGELILAGVGVGDHYTTATWDDRAMIVKGPGALATRKYVRATLERHGVTGERLPAPLREKVRAPDYTDRVRRLEQSGSVTRFLQAHNRTGWGTKDATYIQMLLYDLAPAGTVIVVPDGLWTSYQWMAQLVGAALRGCHVFVVAPGRDNAPSNEFPQMSAMQELVTRLTLVHEVLGPAIRDGGGELRVGLFAREAPLTDLSASLEQIEHAWNRYPFLRAHAPLSAASFAVFARESERLRAGEARPTLVIGDEAERLPQLHRKTQWLVGGDVLRAVVSAPVMPELLTRGLEGFGFGAASGPPESPWIEDPRGRSTRELMQLHSAMPQLVQDNVLYFMTGSINKNVRSMALDAEVVGVIAGPWVMETFLDLLVLTASVTWIESLADVERLLPPYSPAKRVIGRWLHPIL
jgi:phosphatidylserine/phosphatidylglycerophosphate/cardiolipin synthase-like enzyme